MTRYLDKTNPSVHLNAKDEAEKEVVRYFKEVCLRDGLEMREEILKLLRHDWVIKHPRPGNPQKQIIQYDDSEKDKSLCEIKGCNRPAEYLCFSAFMFGKDRRLCRMHAHNESRKGNLRGTRKLKS